MIQTLKNIKNRLSLVKQEMKFPIDNFVSFKKILGLSMFMALLMTAGGCADKDLELSDPKTEPNETVTDFDGYSLSFTVDLDAVQGTRDDDDYDNYIDTKNKFRVLFFDKNGNFIFEAIDRTVTPITTEDESSNTRKSWFVHVPVNNIVDHSGNKYDVTALRDQLRKNDFKIAVLANWPNAGVPQGSEETPEDGTILHPEPYYTKGEPNWGLRNSVIYYQTYDPSNDLHIKIGKPDPKNINDLHHLEVDETYGKEERSYNSNNQATRPSNYDCYGFMMKSDKKMGVYLDWVDNYPETGTKEDARFYIRNTVGTAKTANIDKKKYGTLWYLWNFSAARARTNYKRLRLTNNSGAEEDMTDAMATAWMERNHKTDKPLSVFMNNNENNVKTATLLDDTDDAKLYFDNNKWEDAKKLKIVTDWSYTDKDGKTVTETNRTSMYMPNQNSDGSQDKQTDATDENAYGIRFTANSTGTLKVLFASAEEGNEIQLAIYNSSSKTDSNFSKIINEETGETVTTTSSRQPVTFTRSISITGDPENIYIYVKKGRAANIFQIEYICDQYLYETTRDAKDVTKDNPIPMYGVQNFTKLGDNWLDGTSYNLSNPNNNGKNIYLLRSLAKIELYIPVNTGNTNASGQPSFVFMRSMNRHSRLEPMDVETPTEEIWNNMKPVTSSTTFEHNETFCEWYNLRKHGPLYSAGTGKGETNSDEDYATKFLPDYIKWLSWFYGSWGNTKWRNNGTESWNFPGLTSVGKDLNNTPYPHVFNPRINRSDYATMLYKESDGVYYKYVIYMPDRNIDDPNYPGMTESLPKVAHIEFRYNKRNDVTDNLNDNECYRVYFGSYEQGGIIYNKANGLDKDKYESEFEKDPNVLNSLYPIMRNHIYQLYMKSGSPVVEFDVKVTDWGGTPVTYVDW